MHVIFVHGLYFKKLPKHHEAVWRPRQHADASEEWWGSWLAEQTPGLAIHALEYGAEAVGRPLSRQEFAQAALDLVGSSLPNDGSPIVFICHSHGGLLVKQMVITALEQQNQRLERLVQRIRGVLFAGTPHRANGIAWVASKVIGAFAGQLYLPNPLSILVKEIGDENIADVLQKKYRIWAEDKCVLHRVFYEKEGIFLGYKVVRKASADPQIKGEEPIACEGTDHFSIIQPESSESQIVLSSQRLVEDCLRETALTSNGSFKLGGVALPSDHTQLYGRQNDLTLIWSAWGDPSKRVVAIYGPAVQGKTSLLEEFIRDHERLSWRGVGRAFRWSFRGQGLTRENTAGDDFWRELAQTFDCDPQSIHQAGGVSRIVSQARRLYLAHGFRSLIVLDGLEVLQSEPDKLFHAELKDKKISQLIDELRGDSSCLLLLSSQRRVYNLRAQQSTIIEHELEKLSPSAAAQLLINEGIVDPDAQNWLYVAAEGRPGALIIGAHRPPGAVVGSVDTVKAQRAEAQLSECVNSWVAEFTLLSQQPPKAGRPFASGVLELLILRSLTLFDGPASRSEVLVAMGPASDTALKTFGVTDYGNYFINAVKSLEGARILEAGAARALAENKDERLLTVLPHVRWLLCKSFSNELAFKRNGHVRLSDHYLQGHAQLELREKDTINGIGLLFASAGHLVGASDSAQAFHNIYLEKIQGKTRRLRGAINALSTEVAFLRKYFGESWSAMPLMENARPDSRLQVCYYSHYCLRALGRTQEMLELSKFWQSLPEFESAPLRVEYLTDLCESALIIGDFEGAVAFGKQAVDAETTDILHKVRAHLYYGLSLMRRGNSGEFVVVESQMKSAVERQKDDKKWQTLTGVQAYIYGQYLVERGDLKVAGVHALEARQQAHGRPLSLLSRSIADAQMARVQHLQIANGMQAKPLTYNGSEDIEPLEEARSLADAAVEGLQQCQQPHFLVEALLVRAGLHRSLGDFELALKDIAHARTCIDYAGLLPYQIDECFEACYLAIARGDRQHYQDWIAWLRHPGQAPRRRNRSAQRSIQYIRAIISSENPCFAARIIAR
ncbi:MAG: NACHT domain-containing protein [Hyphomicrobiaceae bacterium]